MRYLIIFLIVFLFVSNSLSQFYYPLQIGNYWEYSSDYRKQIPNDTILPNGKLYSIVRIHGTDNFKLQRNEDQKVLQFDKILNEEIVIFDFTKSDGELVSKIGYGSNFLDTLIIVCKGTQRSNIFGSERLQYKFWHYPLWGFDIDVVYTITDSIGITYIDNAWGTLNLLGAIIDGKRYGNQIVSVYNKDLPTNYQLLQNYPNPFNPTTNFQFSIVNSELTILKVYDVLGRVVSTLVNEVKQPGEYSVTWDASNIPSGVYFYRLVVSSIEPLQTKSYTETKKMILMK